jgi:hypothetical protein
MLIELDRKGINDCVFYDCGNTKFKAIIQSYGFVSAYGSYTDIDTISKAWDIASVNLSIGYYNAHMKTEYTLFSGIEYTLNRLGAILDDESKFRYYDYQETVKYKYNYNNYYNHNKTKSIYKVGDKVKYLGDSKRLKKGAILTVTLVYSQGLAVKDGITHYYVYNDEVCLAKQDKKDKKKTFTEGEKTKVDNEIAMYGYSSTKNDFLAKKLKDTYDVEWDDDMQLYHVMELKGDSDENT